MMILTECEEIGCLLAILIVQARWIVVFSSNLNIKFFTCFAVIWTHTHRTHTFICESLSTLEFLKGVSSMDTHGIEESSSDEEKTFSTGLFVYVARLCTDCRLNTDPAACIEDIFRCPICLGRVKNAQMCPSCSKMCCNTCIIVSCNVYSSVCTQIFMC
jgi:hypothetical protein